METPDEKYFETNEKLKAAYETWLGELRRKAPKFLGDGYSNPYYTCVPKGWYEAQRRILIVGEEGFGTWGRGKEDGVKADDIDAIQTFCWNSLASYLRAEEMNHQLYPEAERYANNTSPFWQRARKLNEYGVCAWSNIDKIHHRAEKKCALSEDERRQLHSLNTRILREEIHLLDPTHIVFFGWYGISLEDELPELFHELYPKGQGDDTRWKNTVLNLPYGGRNYLFSYHPNWGVRHTGYEAKVVEVFEGTL